MKSVVIHAAKDLRIEERPIIEPGPNEVQLTMEAGGICGSDLHYYNHGGFGTIKVREPLVLGHEVSGRIAKLGSGVAGLEVGQLVSVSPSRPCGTCNFCQEGLHNHCDNMRFYGSAMPFPHIQGAFRQTLTADASQCVIAEGLTAGEAALAEPLAVVLHAIGQAGPLVGKSVLITGCGPIGVLAILAARRAGADLVVATDLTEFTLSMAKQLGADHTINMGHDADQLEVYTANKGAFDVLLECSGAVPALRAGIPAMRPQGTIVQVGMGGDMTLPVQMMTAKELAFKGSFRFHPEFATGVSLMRKGLIDVKPLITHTFGIDNAVDGFELANDRTQAMKTIISFA